MAEIAVVNLQKANGDGKVKAFCDVNIGGVMLIRGCRLVDGKKGTFVGMPQKPIGNGKWFNIISIVDKGFHDELQSAVLEAYSK